MNPELITISEEILFEYLNQKDQPVMEFDIIKYFIPSPKDNPDEQSLYVKHFSLYHALYKLKFSAGSKGFYLHLDCMRIRLIQIPEQGRCRHYDAEKGNFCMSAASGDYCIFHEGEYLHYMNSATFDYLYDFYNDPGNITFGESDILKKLMSGVRVYCSRRKDIDEALHFFGIHKPGKKLISNRYRELAGKFHPDRCGGSEEMMKKLNSSYMVLKEVFII
ncbi:MAG TPA: J domain-containing protein [Spirochaetota bacterium]|nr:J domain-containing protein [Spirochaetota bacterium]